ncbi:hypothetical protein TRVL_07307 [Trypanosoma vivax]|nr:hypothetical protein TRVL_07307 [Trypanosoma vivax]
MVSASSTEPTRMLRTTQLPKRARHRKGLIRRHDIGASQVRTKCCAIAAALGTACGRDRACCLSVVVLLGARAIFRREVTFRIAVCPSPCATTLAVRLLLFLLIFFRLFAYHSNAHGTQIEVDILILCQPLDMSRLSAQQRGSRN